MTAYQLLSSPNIVLRTADGVFVPADPRNTDWQAYEVWLAAGNTPDPYVVPPPPPPSCQLWQLQAVMTGAQWEAAQNAIASLNNPAVSAFFQHGTNSIPANSSTLVQLGEDIGLTADQITALVTQASAIKIP